MSGRHVQDTSSSGDKSPPFASDAEEESPGEDDYREGGGSVSSSRRSGVAFRESGMGESAGHVPMNSATMSETHMQHGGMRASAHNNGPVRVPLPRSGANGPSQAGLHGYTPVYYSTGQAYLPQVYPFEHSNSPLLAREGFHPMQYSPGPLHPGMVPEYQYGTPLDSSQAYGSVPSTPLGAPASSHPPRPPLQDSFRPSRSPKHSRQSSVSSANSSSLRRLRDVEFDLNSSDDDQMVRSEDDCSSGREYTSSRHSRYSRSRRIQAETEVKPKEIVDSPTERLKRKRRLISLVLICSLVLFAGLCEILETEHYCVPEDISTLPSSYELVPSDGTVTVLSIEFTQGEHLLMHVTLRNTGSAIGNPMVHLFYYNPNDQRPGSKMVEVTFYLKGCQRALKTGVQTINLQIPFPSEKALQMAIDLRASLNLRIEGESGRIVHSSTIQLPAEIIFAEWIETLAGRKCRFMVFGEQGSGKSTMINDLLNVLHSQSSFINYTPPPTSIQDAGTIGVVRVTVPEDVATLLESSIIAFDTEGSRTNDCSPLDEVSHSYRAGSVLDEPRSPLDSQQSTQG